MIKKIKVICAVSIMALCLGGCSLQPANRNYNKGVAAYEAGNYEEAETYLQKAIEKNSDKAEYYLEYGFTLIQLGNYQEAVKQFNRVIMDNDVTMVKENNKRACRGKGIALLQSGDYSGALEVFNQALDIKELKLLDDDILFYKGLTLENQGEFDEAIEIYSTLLKTHEKDAALYNTRANLYRKLNDYEASLTDYDQALKLSKDDFELYFGKFTALKELGREEDALAVLNEAASLTVTSSKDKFNLAKVHYYQGDYVTASTELLTALSDGFTEANYFLGEISLADKKYEGAINYYKAYKDAGNIESAMFYNQLMVCYLNIGDYEKAKESFDRANGFSTVTIAEQLLRNEIILLEKSGDFAGALNKMDEYMKNYTPDEETKNDYEFLKTRVINKNESSSEENNTEGNVSSEGGSEGANGDSTTVNKP